MNTIAWHNVNECEKETPTKQSSKWANVQLPPPPRNYWRVFIVFMIKAIATRVICVVYIFWWFYIHFTFAYAIGITIQRVEYQLKILQMQKSTNNTLLFFFLLTFILFVRSTYLTASITLCFLLLLLIVVGKNTKKTTSDSLQLIWRLNLKKKMAKLFLFRHCWLWNSITS